jgi:hypothetical protein
MTDYTECAAGRQKFLCFYHRQFYTYIVQPLCNSKHLGGNIMSQARPTVLQRFNRKYCCTIISLPLLLLGVADVVKSQVRGLPGPAAREGNRAMDEYDRAINRMKNDAKAARERRRNLFPQINDDFQRIQVIHNEIVRMIQPEKNLDYDRLADLTDDMKKRSSRLRENLSLPEPDNTKEKTTHSEAVDESHMKKNIVALHDLVVSFVANPIFKNLGVVDATVIEAATENLENIIDMSDEIKREAKILGRSAKNH